MPNSLSTNFRQEFPGPFDYYPSHDGVDETFELTCLTTDDFVIATHYWDEREWAETRVAVAAAVLNDDLSCLCPKMLAEFRRLLPGPYYVEVDYCEYTGVYFCVRCRGSGHTVIYTNGRNSDLTDCVVCQQIAAALNTAFAASG